MENFKEILDDELESDELEDEENISDNLKSTIENEVDRLRKRKRTINTKIQTFTNLLRKYEK